MNLKDTINKFNFNNDIIIDEKERLPFEIFLPITNKVIADIKENMYFISNYSRVYSTYSKKILKMKINKRTGYYTFTVACNHKKQTTVNLHRVLMLVFYPDIDASNLIINHKDGNKLNSFLYNLEFTTSSGNAIHARDNNLLHPSYGKNHCMATISEATCRSICSMIESRNYTLKQIANHHNIPIHIVDSIKQGKAWKHISKDYNISFKYQRGSKYFTNEELHKICEYFQCNPKKDDERLMEYVRNCLTTFNKPSTLEYTDCIRKLYRKQKWKYIWVNYNY